MIDKVANILTNPSFVNLAQNTKATVSIESLFKATGRPAFIMMDKSVDKKTRVYAATKEGLYQMLCLGIYLTMVPFVFKKYGFKISQKILKNQKCIPDFKNADEYLNYLKLASMPKEKRAGNKLLDKISDDLRETPEAEHTLKENLLNLDKEEHVKSMININRKQFEEKWDDLKIFIDYGMLTQEDFYDRAKEFALLEDTDKKYYTFDEYKNLVKEEQTDKDGTLIYLYANNVDEQYSYIEAAKSKGYNVLLMNGQLDVAIVNLLEQKLEK